MSQQQQQFDDAMFDFSKAEYDSAIAKLGALLKEHPDHFDAQLALGMSFYRKGDYQRAIEEGLKAEKMNPREQLVHTNLSLFYMKAGDKMKAEHHGLQAKINSWRSDMKPPEEQPQAGNDELQISKPEAKNVTVSGRKFPDMPWKKDQDGKSK